ncbi:MAG: family 16 glycosylhydrolase [Polyangiaceae bacterium]|nr:family 16 glycosylhydrolase [Polyangiaceae bacterium]
MIHKWLTGWLVPVVLGAAGPALAVSSAELYRGQASTYGRFEARIRFAPGDGVVSSFFLWKSGSEVAGAYWNELDFEKLGADCRLQTNIHYGAPVAQDPQTDAVAGNLCAEYHTYGFEWTPTYIAWLVDGLELRRETGAAATAFAENASAGMQFRFNIWPGDASFGGNFDPAVLPVQQYIAWVQYSSFADGTFTQQWREEFDGTALPSGWSAGTWASPKSYSTHLAANVVFVGGIAVLSLTPDDATGFTGDPPADDATGGSPGSAGTAPTGATLGGSNSIAGGGSSTGGASATGGLSTGAGGQDGAPSSGGASSVGGNSATPNANPDNGCSCRMPVGSRSAGGSGLLAASIALALASLRRRTPRTRQHARPPRRRQPRS